MGIHTSSAIDEELDGRNERNIAQSLGARLRPPTCINPSREGRRARDALQLILRQLGKSSRCVQQTFSSLKQDSRGAPFARLLGIGRIYHQSRYRLRDDREMTAVAPTCLWRRSCLSDMCRCGDSRQRWMHITRAGHESSYEVVGLSVIMPLEERCNMCISSLDHEAGTEIFWP